MLIRTRTAFGGFDIWDDVPRLTVIRNAMVIGWALYDDRRLLVPDSPFTREDFAVG